MNWFFPPYFSLFFIHSLNVEDFLVATRNSCSIQTITFSSSSSTSMRWWLWTLWISSPLSFCWNTTRRYWRKSEAHHKKGIEHSKLHSSFWMQSSLAYESTTDKADHCLCLNKTKKNRDKTFHRRNDYELKRTFRRVQNLKAMEQFIPMHALHSISHLAHFGAHFANDSFKKNGTCRPLLILLLLPAELFGGGIYHHFCRCKRKFTLFSDL